LNKVDLNIIKFYEQKYTILQQKFLKHEQKEPFKIFKKKHHNWQLKKEELENELEKYSNKITNKYKEIESTTLIDLK